MPNRPPDTSPYVTISSPQIGLEMTCYNCEAYTRTMQDGRHLVVFDLDTNAIRHELTPGSWQTATICYGDRPVTVFHASVLV